MRQIRDTAFGRKHKIRQVHRPVHLRFQKILRTSDARVGSSQMWSPSAVHGKQSKLCCSEKLSSTLIGGKRRLYATTRITEGISCESSSEQVRYDLHLNRNRQWHTVLAVDSVSSQSIASLKEDGDVIEALLCVTRTRRSTYWQMILDLFKGLDQIIGCSLEDLKRSLEYGSDMLILENCIDNLGNPQNLRAIEAYSGGARLDAKLQSNIQSQYGWTKFLYHIEPSHDDRSTVEGEESAVKEERQACFFTAVDPMNFPMLTPLGEENEPRMIPYKNEMEKWSEYSIVVRSVNCSRQRNGILSKSNDIIVWHYASR